MQIPVKSILQYGVSGLPVEIECAISNGLPNIVIVGLGNKIIDESKERIRSAFKSSGVSFPRKRIIINLAPADIPKNSPSFDLAIATSIMCAAGIITIADTNAAFIGELSLDGKIRSVRGIVGMLLGGKKHGISHFYIPAANTKQASLVPGITFTPVASLKELMRECVKPLTTRRPIIQNPTPPSPPADAINEIAGQAIGKRALCIAAAGGHNIFLSGPPGSGKSMLAKALPALMPPMSSEEILEATQLHSLASHDFEELVTARPFRAPHHNASLGAMVGGGGNRVKPGEISLSHHGVLLLDEMPEFSRTVLEALRQPLEDRKVTIARVHDSVAFPAEFILVATANPCPCGFYGSGTECSCPPYRIQQYQQKISGPIMDRIDLFVAIAKIEHERLLHAINADTAEDLRSSVVVARHKQFERCGAHRLNATLSNTEIKKYACVSPAALSFLNTAAKKLNLSARAYMRVLKVARTIADLEASNTIEQGHLSEALQFRKPQTDKLL